MIYNAELAVCKLKTSATMKLLLILPNLVLIAVAGINLSNELSAAQLHKNLSVIVLHFSVLLMCVVFISLIIRSMFRVSVKEDATHYQEIELGQTIRL